MAYGFVYFITNPSMPGLTKIGMTTKHPRERMDELSKATACPTPFEMLAFFDSAVPREAEQAIHAALDEYRENPYREFFRVNAENLQDQARQWCDPHDGIVFLRLLNDLVEQEEQEEIAEIHSWMDARYSLEVSHG